MKNCYRCNHSELDDSSLFCSNCGNSFKLEAKFVSQSKSQNVNNNENIKEKILGSILILSVVLWVSIVIVTGVSWLFLISFFISIIVLFLFVNLRYSYNFNKKKNTDTFNDEVVKLGSIMSVRHQ